MKVNAEDLKVGDIFLTQNKGETVYCKVVEIFEQPLFEPITFNVVHPIIVDEFVYDSGVHMGRRVFCSTENDITIEVLYRENPEPYNSLEEEIKKRKN